MQVYFTLRRVIAQRSANLVHPRPKRLPPRAPDDEVRHLLAVPTPRLHPDVELQKGVGDGVVEGYVHGFEGLKKRGVSFAKGSGRENGRGPNRDNLGVAHYSVRQRERQDDLNLERRDVAVRGDVVHRVQ